MLESITQKIDFDPNQCHLNYTQKVFIIEKEPAMVFTYWLKGLKGSKWLYVVSVNDQ